MRIADYFVQWVLASYCGIINNLTILINLTNSPSVFWEAHRNKLRSVLDELKGLQTRAVLHFWTFSFTHFFLISFSSNGCILFFTNYQQLHLFKSHLPVCSSVRSWRSRRAGSGRRAPSWELRVMGRIWAVCWNYYKNTRLWLENCWLTGHCCRCVCMSVFLSVCVRISTWDTHSASSFCSELYVLMNLCISIYKLFFQLDDKKLQLESFWMQHSVL